MHWIVLLTALWLWPSPVLADGGHDHHAVAVPTLKNQVTTTVTVKDNTVTLTFGPIDLPSGHEGDLAASLPKHIFQLPKDMYMVGFKSAVFTQEGKPLPRNYLHHILMLNNDKPSVSCPGEPLFFSGAGLEMTEAQFPEGYGVKLSKGQHLMSVVAFYHKAPPTKNVMATFTMYMAPEDHPWDVAGALLQAGHVLVDAGMASEARRAAREMKPLLRGTEDDFNLKQEWRLLEAAVARISGKPAKALELTERVKGADGYTVATRHRERARALRDLGRTGEAAVAYQEAIAVLEDAGERWEARALADELAALGA